MSDNKKQPLSVTDYYHDLYELHGAVMDAESYARHSEANSQASEPVASTQASHTAETSYPTEASTPNVQSEVNLDAVFSEPQDLRQIVAEQIEADQRIEYRPECVTYVIPHVTGETGVTTETLVFGEPCLIRCGSGSYLSSGSYGSYLTSGSYRTSGFYLTSGSYHTSGSYRTSGSFRFGSFRLSSGSYRGSFRIPMQAFTNLPYLGSFGWGFDLGGYGLDLI